MRKRLEFTKATKTAAYERAAGKCECCGHAFGDGERVDYDHIIPDAMRPDNSLGNCQVLCQNCHLEKTKGDVTQIAKAKRVEKKHRGEFRLPRQIIPGSRASRFRKALSGAVSIRKSGEVIRRGQKD